MLTASSAFTFKQWDKLTRHTHNAHAKAGGPSGNRKQERRKQEQEQEQERRQQQKNNNNTQVSDSGWNSTCPRANNKQPTTVSPDRTNESGDSREVCVCVCVSMDQTVYVHTPSGDGCPCVDVARVFVPWMTVMEKQLRHPWINAGCRFSRGSSSRIAFRTVRTRPYPRYHKALLVSFTRKIRRRYIVLSTKALILASSFMPRKRPVSLPPLKETTVGSALI